MTNYNKRIDEILALLAARIPQPKTMNEATARVAMLRGAKQAIFDWHNKQVERAYSDGFQKAAKGAFKSQQEAKREAVRAVLDRLEVQMVRYSDDFKDGDAVPVQAIRAERNKLKEK